MRSHNLRQAWSCPPMSEDPLAGSLSLIIQKQTRCVSSEGKERLAKEYHIPRDPDGIRQFVMLRRRASSKWSVSASKSNPQL